MNVRIFWVRAMKCMCAQTRPRFILSSERVFGGMEFEPMLTPRKKSSLPENFPTGGSNQRRWGQRAQTLPTSYSGPRSTVKTLFTGGSGYSCLESKRWKMMTVAVEWQRQLPQNSSQRWNRWLTKTLKNAVTPEDVSKVKSLINEDSKMTFTEIQNIMLISPGSLTLII